MELLDQLNINPQAILINIVGFILLWFALQRLVFKPIDKVLDERQEDISGKYDRLEADQRQMEVLRNDYERRLAQIEAEAREKIQSAIKEAQSARDQIVSEAQSRSKELITRAESEAEREREQAMITFRQQVTDLALNAAEKVIGDSLDSERQRRLIDDFISANGSGSAPAQQA